MLQNKLSFFNNAENRECLKVQITKVLITPFGEFFEFCTSFVKEIIKGGILLPNTKF